MITTIDNAHRVFLIYIDGLTTRNYFCNLQDIQKCLFDAEGYKFKIFHYLNKKFKRISKKEVNEMLIANQVNYQIK